jgi:multidrug efflux pump subunit AcrB
MEIEADPKMLDAYGLSIGNLVRRLRDEGVEILAQRETTLEVRTKYRPDALLDLVLDTRQGSPIRLRDVARIHVRP